MSEHNLEVLVKEDGVWLSFKTNNGLHAALNVQNMPQATADGITARALRTWCHERYEARDDV